VLSTRFLAGFGVASVLWGAFLFSYKQGWIDISLEPEAPPADEASVTDSPQDDDGPDKPARPRKKRPGGTSAPKRKSPGGNALVGDDLGENDTRNLNVGQNGGEEQLRNTEIERGFDGILPQVKRCLILAADDEPASGKLVFGLRISGAGKVTAVNLSGPSSVTRGDSGACLRKAAQGMHFRTFNGPDMVAHYPLTLE
jgi:hypothetical protein